MGQGGGQNGGDYNIIHEPPLDGGGGDVPLCLVTLHRFTIPGKGEGRLGEDLGGRAGQVDGGREEGV